jgi:UDP-N-acetylmuramate dehydrogenase
MVIEAREPDSRSVGSFFVNPVITPEEFDEVKRRAGEEIPSFPAADGRVKLSAAWLIEQAGIHRGSVRGNVGTSSKHALAIINRGGGTAREVLELAAEIKSRVLDRFGVALAPEPIFIGMRDE